MLPLHGWQYKINCCRHNAISLTLPSDFCKFIFPFFVPFSLNSRKAEVAPLSIGRSNFRNLVVFDSKKVLHCIYDVCFDAITVLVMIFDVGLDETLSQFPGKIIRMRLFYPDSFHSTE